MSRDCEAGRRSNRQEGRKLVGGEEPSSVCVEPRSKVPDLATAGVLGLRSGVPRMSGPDLEGPVSSPL